MPGKLRSYVHVADADGVMHAFGPDSRVVPAWAAAQITNPAAWETPPPDQLPAPSTEDESAAALAELGRELDSARDRLATVEGERDDAMAKVDDLEGERDAALSRVADLEEELAALRSDRMQSPAGSMRRDGTGDDDGGERVPVPPRSGAGSGRDAWAAYAEDHGFEVEATDGREEIIAGLAAAGIAVE